MNYTHQNDGIEGPDDTPGDSGGDGIVDTVRDRLSGRTGWYILGGILVIVALVAIAS